MADKKVFPDSQLPIRRTVDFLPNIFKTESNAKFLGGVFDPLVQPGVVEKTVGYIGKRYGKTFNGKDVYLDTDQTLRSRYQLDPGVTVEDDQKINKFFDYLDLKNTLNFFGNTIERDDKLTEQEHYSWNPPIDWDKFVNYREYYWVPAGCPSVPVFGQSQNITSTYKVRTGSNSTWVFTPDGVSNNPTITLYRGQTYKFEVNSAGDNFFIRTNYDTGSLNFDPNKTYFTGELAVFNNKLWRAKVEVSPADGSSIDTDSQDWELVDDVATFNSLLYSKGVTNNGTDNGTITFTVPFDSPDILYYQSDVNANRLGKFVIADIDSNTFIDVEKEIVGKTNYTSSNNIEFSNGLVVEFRGQVVPEKYSKDTWLIEGVGNEIQLIRLSDLVPPVVSADTPEILFDNQGFDTQPFDDASQYPANKDYITISRTSPDSNPWSRYNRWFHKSVLEYAANLRGDAFDGAEPTRAKRPIIEFKPGIQLFNHGGVAKQIVDYIDDYTTDVFSTIEGSTGYSIDGEFLFNGARILITADTDGLVNNKIYEVNFITHNGRRQINLKEAADSTSVFNECVLVRRGINNAGKMYHFNGTNWIKSQEKIKVNQPPLFDGYDENGVSFGDPETYPVSTFKGSPLLSYVTGNSVTDKELGFSLSYLNIDNVGDIKFNWNWEKDNFAYTENQTVKNKNLNTGYFKIGSDYQNGWIITDNKFIQPIIDTTVIQSKTNEVQFNTVDWNFLTDNAKINFYLNGNKLTDSFTRVLNTFVFASTVFQKNDAVSLKIVDDIEPDQGYYEIPIGLENNPLNENLTSFTLGQAIDHVKSGLEFDDRFSGKLPGTSNLRDLSGYEKHTKRFLKHSGLSSISTALLCDKEINLIKSLQYAKKQYQVFKDNFIKKATELPYNDSIRDFVDDIIADISRTKNSESPFADSDMLGTGAFSKIDYVVSDTGIKTFSLSDKFDLQTLSRVAKYVYLNDVQLLHGVDYVFNSSFGYITILKDLTEGDKIEIREYVSTASSFIPPTPSSLGLYKKYTPKKIIDDTYRENKEVIQGHDGSITLSYDDYRDDLLLELEYRIYNNIKKEYDPDVFDIDKSLGGYYKNALFTKEDLDKIVSQEFLKWVSNTNLGYTNNDFFIENEEFTYTYSNMTDPTGTENLPGWWRGVYQYFYDTIRPHTHPWEMLGFSEKPTWWDEEYGPAPYTEGNLLLWEDIRDGVIRQGDRQGRHSRYARTSILSHIPVDCDGNLVDPLNSGLAGNFTLINNKGSFKLGDVGPVEYAWRSSSEYPFAIIIALSLLRPFEFIITNLDRSKNKSNILGQIVDVTSNTFLKKTDILLPIPGQRQTAGLLNYVSAYVISQGKLSSFAQDILSHINVRLSTRISGFVDKEQQKYLLDSKNPSSTSSSIFVPPENYDIIFNVSSPIQSISYSGVIIEKTSGGWIVNGYDDIKPYFNYYQPIPNQKDPTISVGGVSETFVVWSENQKFNNGSIVQYRNDYFRANKTHTSTDEFESENWSKLPNLPVKNAVTAQRRRNFNRFNLLQMSYGTTIPTIQQVVDFLLGYQDYLISLGFVFEKYDPDNQIVQDWTTSAKEFMFWTKHNWAEGSLLSVSPGAEKLTLKIPVGVADNLVDAFNDYNVLQGNGQPFDLRNVNVNRSFQTFEISTTNTTEGIYYLKVNYVLKEHVTIFDDRTVFNDVIFDKPTGYRQERIKSQGFRTTDWDGDYTSPGFLFDNVNISTWVPYTDYRLGDIIAYRSYYWTAKENHTGGESFDDTNWTRLDSEPQKQLIPNFDYRVNQIEDYFAVSSEGLGKSQRDLARHTIGYQTRDYLSSLAEDSVTQFRLYQGFIREKGSSNSITKLFDKIGRSGESSVELDEEWAFKVGELGGTDQTKNLELKLTTDNFNINPQPILITDDKKGDFLDRYIRLDKTDFNYAPFPYTTALNPVSYDARPIKTAGYVKIGQTEYTVKTRDDILNIDISQLQDNDHIWVTFDGPDWTVLRANYYYDLPIVNINIVATTVTVTFNKRHNLNVGDIIGIKDIEGLEGFYKITASTATEPDGSTLNKEFSLQFEVEAPAPQIEFADSSLLYPILLIDARFTNYDSIEPGDVAMLNKGSKLFVDSNPSGRWEVVEKNAVYNAKKITNYGISQPEKTGYAVAYNKTYKQIIASMPTIGYVTVSIETSAGISVKQILEPPAGFENIVNGSFGKSIALTPDDKFLIIGSPEATGVKSPYRGIFDPNINYGTGDIVQYGGKLWRCVSNVFGDGSSINVYTGDWEIIDIIEAFETESASDLENQGMISIYEFAAQQWNYVTSFVSGRPATQELFGHKIAVGKDGDKYRLAVTAPGAGDGKGRVYLFTYNATDGWTLDENIDYRGIFDPSAFYPAGSIVFYNGNLWQAQYDVNGDGSTIDVQTNDWLKLDEISTRSSLPTSIALEDDGSTLSSGILSPDQISEFIKQGDKFGSSITMNYDGSVVAVGAPFSDGEYFPNYKGEWSSTYEYIEGDVVRYDGGYHKLTDTGPNQTSLVDGNDSTIRSYNEEPGALPWQEIGDSTTYPVGKVYIYRRNEQGILKLKQTITAGSMSEISDLDPSEILNIGDQFGHDLSLDYSGNLLAITSPKADINFQNQGSAYLLRYESDSSFLEFRIKQKLESYGKYPNEYFGQSICIAPNREKIIIGANNSPYRLPTVFDNSQTSFDNATTKFKSYSGFSGSVYVFEPKGNTYYLSEKLEDDLSLNESFGFSVACDSDVIVVGSPDYITPAPHGVDLAFEGDRVGTVRLFKKPADTNPLTVLGTQIENVVIENIKRIALYEDESDVKIQDIEIVDPAKLKILNSAERELSYKTSYDPAVYNVGSGENVTVDESIAWYGKNVGKLWWNLNTVKWLDYEQGDTAYRLGNWGRLAEGASVDVYEWVESKLLPSEWSAIADTTEGLQLGISGVPLYSDDNVYSKKELLNVNTGETTETLYYYWVKDKTTIPKNVLGRSISAVTVANTITNPSAVGNTFIALADSNKFIFYNYKNIVGSDKTILNLEYHKSKKNRNAIHNEYQLLTEGVADSIPPIKIENKLIDSLVGYDIQGNRVPDTDLPEKQKYGIKYRPRQSMFVDRKPILKLAIEKINEVLLRDSFADFINFENLNLFDVQPNEILNLWDQKVASLVDLQNVGTVRVRNAELKANIIDDEINSIDIVDPGFGYKIAPNVEFEGDGQGAAATTTIDSQGRINSVTVTNKGRKYNTVITKVRNFSVLVEVDSSANNFWSIYAWDDERQSFFRSASQGFDTRKYWSYADWWATGYGPTSRIVKEIPSVIDEEALEIQIGDIIRIKEYGAGGWAVFEKINNTGTIFLERFKLIGRQNGTIQLSNALYDIEAGAIGYDSVESFDTDIYDKEPTDELRNIFRSVKNDIFIGDYAIEWNTLFFICVRYVFHEQTYVDWAFKTSFLNATHNVGELSQPTNYRNDNLDSYFDYINEVKPYRTTIREYVSKYNKLENGDLATSDFDLPPYYSADEGKIITANETQDIINTYPYKYWLDNKGHSITEIQIANPGSGYTTQPTVVIEGNGTGATAQAYISNGRVSGVRMLTFGNGYTKTPTVSLVGGNGNNTDKATAVPVLGNSKFRSFDLTMKLDRINKEGRYANFNYSQTFTATGTSAVFELSYAPTRDKSEITLIKNGQLVLPSEYTIHLYKNNTDNFDQLKGKIVFEIVPEAGDILQITYAKNDELLDSVNRINKYYSPTSGMKGTDLSQLMTGVDFGGVRVQGTTFDVTGGWDALPWFTDNWDSVQTSSDYYFVVEGSTTFVTLPYVPEDGQIINIYLKRAGNYVPASIDDLQYSDNIPEPPTVRIDDPYFPVEGEDSTLVAGDSSLVTNENAVMPTFVGDGSTMNIEVGSYVQLNAGDILIFRPQESDGAVTITDTNIVDTNLSGGTLSYMDGAYATANGLSAEDISIEGGQYISPDQVPAPEENIPGQVLDSLSIKVFQTTGSGAATLQSTLDIGDGSTSEFDIGQNILENKSAIVYVDSIKQIAGTDYNVDISANTINFTSTPAVNAKIEIVSIGIGGLEILDYQEFVADGDTALFLTNANYNTTSQVFVSVNGIEQDAGFVNSTDVVDSVGRTLVQFGEKPPFNAVVKIIVLGSSLDTDSSQQAIVRVNQQTVEFEGSTRSFDLDNFVALQRNSAVAPMVVELNNRKLKGVDTNYYTVDSSFIRTVQLFDNIGNLVGTRQQYEFGIASDPLESPGSVLTSNIKVYVNNELKTFVRDYTYDGSRKVIIFDTTKVAIDDIVKIENDLRSEYTIENNNLVVKSSVSLTTGDQIKVTWFSEYPSMNVVTDRITGGKVNYQLPFKPLSVSYVWVYKNGYKLIQDIDYYIDAGRGVIYIEAETTTSDEITVTVFGTGIYRLPSAYEITKDMLNVYRFKRYSIGNNVTLSKSLNYYDKTIELTSLEGLSIPNVLRNVPGVITVNQEKIEYFEINSNNNTLGKLRRGVQGTSIAELHSSGSYVSNSGADESIPYTENQERFDFVSDGSSLLIGPLDFVPVKTEVANWYRQSIPELYGRCDTVEVFAGGRRLRKTPLTVFDETLGDTSPSGDREVEAEFSVDGSNAYIRLTDAVEAGTRITIVKKVGNTWYDRGTNTASNGVTLLENSTPISKFIAAKSTGLPE